MRLPFMQLESDLVAHGAALVGQLAGCLPAQALGHIAMLRAWAVSQANDETPPDGLVRGDAAPRLIEAAAQWQGQRGTLFDALLDAGQVQRESDGVRVLHLEPYAKAWERNAKAKARMANGRERSANKPDTAGERSAKFMGQTQTQMEDGEETTSSPASAGAVSDGVDDLPDATDDAVPDERPLLTLAYAEPDRPEPKKPKAAKPKPPAEPRGDQRHRPLTDALVAADAEVTGKPYGHRGGRDAKAVSECLALADQDAATSAEKAPAEVLRRWRIARRWRGFPACNSLSDLAANWNAYAREQSAVAPTNLRAPVRAETQPQYDPSKPSCVTLAGRDAI